MAGLYARKLSEQGFAALAFDSRYYGESGGAPRQLESPTAKVQDLKNAITYLSSLPATDRNDLLIPPQRLSARGNKPCLSNQYLSYSHTNNT
jgi:fermentation-respiration switch protein FrsA (DUF1100 family)